MNAKKTEEGKHRQKQKLSPFSTPSSLGSLTKLPVQAYFFAIRQFFGHAKILPCLCLPSSREEAQALNTVTFFSKAISKANSPRSFPPRSVSGDNTNALLS